MNKDKRIEIYKTPEGKMEIQVSFEEDTVWLTQMQMAELFDRNRVAITQHLGNIFKEKELNKNSVCKDFLHTAADGKSYVTKYYNLDIIISVGYRVKSKQGTQFRQWATQRLKEYLVKGYSINEKRLKETQQQFTELKQTIKLLENVLSSKELDSAEATGLLKVVTDYSYALDVLDKYDHQTLKKPSKKSKEKYKINYKEAVDAIHTLKDKFGGSALFGNEKDKSFKSSLENIYLTFQKKELYPGAENKAAHLLYFVVKNHSFTDGNKRIAAFLFIWFLERNGLLYTKEGFKKLEDNTLVALTLMIAESKSGDKGMMINVILNLMQKDK